MLDYIKKMKRKNSNKLKEDHKKYLKNKNKNKQRL